MSGTTTLAVLLSLALGVGTASGAFYESEGESSGPQRRSGFIQLDANNIEPMCAIATGTDPEFWKFASQAAYQYPLLESPSPQVNGSAYVSTGPVGVPSSQVYAGPVYVKWRADKVWDGPRGTMQDLVADTSHVSPTDSRRLCRWGYRWPISQASIEAPAGAPNRLRCSNLKTGTTSTSMGVPTTGASYYARPPLILGDPNGGSEVIKLEFHSCTLDTTPVATTVNNVTITLTDSAHAFCADSNATTSDPNDIGISHCESSYLFS